MRKWYRIALLNLFVVTLLALLLRYKINFPLEFIEQKKILHAHSHFAFNGWISFVLQLLILDLFTKSYTVAGKFWDRFFFISTLINYGMIASFSWQGYGPLSIALSTLGIFLSYIFAYKIYTSLEGDNKEVTSISLLKASLFFLVTSSLGTYALAFVMATENAHTYWYHNSLYFFLHFQYNGWFTFAVLAFLFRKLESTKLFNLKHARMFYVLLVASCIPAYLLTMLLSNTPTIVTIINIVTVLTQAIALIYLWLLLKANIHSSYQAMPVICRWLNALAISGFILKIILQFFSAHPSLGKLAFSFRPIIVGYLHLIFLIFISLYLLSLLAEKNIILLSNQAARSGLIVFMLAAVMNEVLLGVQGAASILYFYLPAIPLLLFVNTIIIVVGAGLIYFSSGASSFRKVIY